MFLVKVAKFTLIATIFLIAYLPVSINPKIFERNEGTTVSII